jgi:hypothetical protein
LKTPQPNNPATEHQTRPSARAAVGALLLLVVAAAAPATTAYPAKPKVTLPVPSDNCAPYKIPAPFKDFDDVCAHYYSLSSEALNKVFNDAPIPTASDTFPLRGCVLGCLPGFGPIAANIRSPDFNQGWSGKCFNKEMDPRTKTPTMLNNIFTPNFGNTSLGPVARMTGKTYMDAHVYFQPKSIADGKPVWTFDYEGSKGIPAPALGALLDASGVRDEVRIAGPGFLVGKMFVKSGFGPPVELPVMFMLFQACTPGGKVTWEPSQRLEPALAV